MATIDKWTMEIAETFMSVFSRARFNAEIVKKGESSNFMSTANYHVVFLFHGQTFKVEFVPMRDYVTVYATTDPISKFKFTQKIPRKNPPSLRKVALILMKKAAHKPVFDIMNA